MPKKDIAALRSIGLVYFLYLFLYSGLEFTVTFLMYHKFGYTSMDQAKMFLTTGMEQVDNLQYSLSNLCLFLGVIMTLLQGSVVRRLPEAKIKGYAIFSLYLIVPAFVVVGLAEGSRMLYAGMTLFAISTAFAVTCLTTLVSKYGNDDQKGSVLGIFRSLGALARALGPVVGCIGELLSCPRIIPFLNSLILDSLLVRWLQDHLYSRRTSAHLSSHGLATRSHLSAIGIDFLNSLEIKGSISCTLYLIYRFLQVFYIKINTFLL